MRISFAKLQNTLRRVLLTHGFGGQEAELGSLLVAETDLDGVYSHGINRFPRFVEQVRSGVVDVEAEPSFVSGSAAVERWDGGAGAGNVTAHRSMERAMELSDTHGIGLVALRNTNHWMRGGSYGWQAAEKGNIGICWTNTMPNLPPWGSSEPRIGNNPLVVAIPRAEGHVVLDSAMSMFSYGALASYRNQGKSLPVDGGYDASDELTRQPAEVEASSRPLPAGFWKGSGLAMVLDMIAALLSDGRATHEIAPDPTRESGLSQTFIAIDSRGPFGMAVEQETVVDRIVEHVQNSELAAGHDRVNYPGERTLATRLENQELGIPVDPDVWHAVQTL